MGLQDLLEFDASSYREKISNCSLDELRNNIYKKRSQSAGGSFGLGASIAAAPASGGVSLIGAVYSGRKLSVASQKLELLEEEWTKRGMEMLDHRWKDVLVPVAVGTATMGLGDVFASAGSAAVNHAGMHAAHNLASQSYHTLSSPPVTASFDSGIKDGIEQTFQVLTPNGHHFATNAATGFPTPNSDAYSFGEMVGMHGTQKALNVATGNLIGRGIGSSNSKKVEASRMDKASANLRSTSNELPRTSHPKATPSKQQDTPSHRHPVAHATFSEVNLKAVVATFILKKAYHGVTNALLSMFLWAIHHFLCGYIAITIFQTSMTTAVSMFVFSFGTCAKKYKILFCLLHLYSIEAFGPEVGYCLLALRLGSLVAYG